MYNIVEIKNNELNQIPNELGCFNIFNFKNTLGNKPKPVNFKKIEYYKISLVYGNAKIIYADKTIIIKNQAIIFSNPLISYKWENLENITKIKFCIFKKDFFFKFISLNEYIIFKPGGSYVFEINNEQNNEVNILFDKMENEFNSTYIYKYDIIRSILIQIIHYGIKLEPTLSLQKRNISSANRIYNLFLDLLERQFPLENTSQYIKLKSPIQFANQLFINVNHLNKTLKKTTGKSTSELINYRIIIEVKKLLLETDLTIKEIANMLGYSNSSHFCNFFKKHTNINPLQFKKV